MTASDTSNAPQDGAAAAHSAHGHPSQLTLAIGAVGIVYGDIGTSPLYAFREAFATAAADGVVYPDEIYGVTSLIIWALTAIITLKYVLVVTRLDNKGEGGILSLMALARQRAGARGTIFLLGLIGAALFYGDAVLTPAISVLSAVEGIKLVTPTFNDYVVPITLVIIVGIFLVQSRGTAKVARFFGPITIVWFLCMAIAAVPHILAHPEVFKAFNPYYAVMYLSQHGVGSLVALGAVFLAITGAEALFADLGHFGRKPIVRAWLTLVFPCLVINYLGQASMVLENPASGENPFFLLVPGWALLPFVLLATIATVIASQAVITGAFSLSRQAIQLGLLPRMDTRHTSETQSGQIYLPRINWLLMIGVIILVVMFRSSAHLASAYGIAVCGVMILTSLMTTVVLRNHWGWGWPRVALVMIPFLSIELMFFGANMLKVFEGGYLPILMAAGLLVVMGTWVRGTRILFDKTRRTDVPLSELCAMLQKSPPHRVKGTAVFLTSDPETAPAALLHNLKHNKVLHEKNVILTVRAVDTPRVAEEERVTIEPVDDTFSRVVMTFGYMETPNIPKGLAVLRKRGFKFDIMLTSFFLSRRSIRPAAHSGMPIWQDKLFIGLSKTASDATDFFQIPTGRVVEVGTQVTI